MANISDFLTGGGGGGGGTLESLTDTNIVNVKRFDRLTYIGDFWENGKEAIFSTDNAGNVYELQVPGGNFALVNNALTSEIAVSPATRIEVGSGAATFTITNITTTDVEGDSPTDYRFVRLNLGTGERTVLREGTVTTAAQIPTTYTDSIQGGSAGNYNYVLEIDDDNVQFPSTGYSTSAIGRGIDVAWFSTPFVNLSTRSLANDNSRVAIDADVTDTDFTEFTYSWAQRPHQSAANVAFTPIAGETAATLEVTADADYRVIATNPTASTGEAFVSVTVNDAAVATISAPTAAITGTMRDFELTVVDSDSQIASATFEVSSDGMTFTAVPEFDAAAMAIALAQWNAGLPYNLANVTLPAAEGDYTYRLSPVEGGANPRTITPAQHVISLMALTTITINFTDNTGAQATLNSAAAFTATGVPGANFTAFTRTVDRVSDATGNDGATFALASVVATEAGDTGNNVTAQDAGGNNSRRTLMVSGTFPAVDATVTLTITVTTNNLATRSCGGVLNIPRPTFNVIPSFGGGGNFSAFATGSCDAFGTLSVVFTEDGGISSGPSGTRTGGVISCGAGSLETARVGYSVGETATHRGCSVSVSRTF